MLSTLLKRIDQLKYYTKMNCIPLSGKYTKPLCFVSGRFDNKNRESKCWSEVKVSKRLTKTLPLKHYTLEINGFRVGRFQDYTLCGTSVTLHNFIKEDTQGYLRKWDFPKNITIYSLTPDGAPSYLIELYHATLQKEWLSNMTISFTKKKVRSL